MPRTLEASGKSIDEAIFNGLRELEISIDEVEIDILQQESKGILGIGSKLARVRLIEREPEEIVLPEYLTNSAPVQSERRDRGDRRGERRNESRGDGRRNENRGESRGEYRGEGRQNEVRNNRYERGANRHESDQPRLPAIPYSAEEAETLPAAQFLKGMLEQMEVSGTVLAHVDDEGIKLLVNTQAMGILIGHRGETLDAIQYLTSLAVNKNRKEDGYVRVTIDTEGYREKREETLQRLARKVAAQVKASGRPRTMEPMNPYERRVFHATLQSSPYVATRSEGEEPNRRVVVFPKPRENKSEE